MTEFEQGSYRLRTEPDDVVLTVDAGSGGSNEFRICLTNRADAPQTTSVEITARCGAAVFDLLPSADSRVEMTFTWDDGGEEKEIFASPHRVRGGEAASWRLRNAQLEPGATLTATLSGFEANTAPGPTALHVLALAGNGADQDKLEADVPVRKQFMPRDDPAIRYLTASSDFCRPEDVEPTIISFLATRPDLSTPDSILFRNGRRVPSVTENPRIGELLLKTTATEGGFQVVGTLRERPGMTSVYRLVMPETQVEPRVVTVQVMTPGWNRIGQPFGYATGLFIGPDYETGDAGGIYGIFVDDRTEDDVRADVYTSKTGLDDWFRVARLPAEWQEMAFSPGAMFDNKLWLVGGSASDFNKRSADLYWFDRSHGFRAPQTASGDPLRLPQDRSGHAIVVVPSHGTEPDRLLIMGGSGLRQQYFDDVLGIVRDGQTPQGQPAYRLETISEHAGWSPRHRHAAAIVREDGFLRVYLYGGRDENYHHLTDLWCWTPGEEVWAKVTAADNDAGDVIRPSPGLPEAAALVALPRFKQDDRFLLLGVFKAPEKSANVLRTRIYERFTREGRWAESELQAGWEVYAGRQFTIQGIATPYSVLVWSVESNRRADRDPMPPLNICTVQ